MLSVPGTQTRLLVLTPDDPHVWVHPDQPAQQLHWEGAILPARFTVKLISMCQNYSLQVVEKDIFFSFLNNKQIELYRPKEYQYVRP